MWNLHIVHLDRSVKVYEGNTVPKSGQAVRWETLYCLPAVAPSGECIYPTAVTTSYCRRQCHHLCCIWDPVSLTFQLGLKTRGSSGILQAFGSRSGVLRHPALGAEQPRILSFSGVQTAIVGLSSLCCVSQCNKYVLRSVLSTPLLFLSDYCHIW